MAEIEDPHRYDDIIDLPHHVSTVRRHMTQRERAAQFSPFAALSGYGEGIDETARRSEDMASETNTEPFDDGWGV